MEEVMDFSRRFERAFVELVGRRLEKQGWKKGEFAAKVWPDVDQRSAAVLWSSACKAESRIIPSPYHSLQIGLMYEDRQVLYDRIDRRVDEMVRAGMVEEAHAVYQNEALRTAYHAIGYKELIPYFENTMPLGECLDKIKQESRRYAKRQLTWFRKNPDIQWIILSKFDKKQEILEKCKKTIANSDLLCYNIS